MPLFQQALSYFVTVDEPWSERLIRTNIVNIHLAAREFVKAEEHVLKIVAISETLNHPELESDREFLYMIQSQITEEDS